ncbi:choice-of-anchor Q domain-containing protein [Aurantibacter sp.]|uniref:choice-of-anchor Q domain-containing protein n=1 Tax=Aurantibacter sp. TaxID=2807103 RepID=UPI0035C79ABF
MKTRLFLILLLMSSFSFAQNWSQVGTAQFTNFADSAEIAFNAISGQPYVVYHNPTNDEVLVETFNGTNWVNVGSTISTQGHNNLAIKVNPVTQEPWVALKRNGSGNGSTIDVYRYDGTSWVSEASNLLLLSGLYTYGIQLQFNDSGNARVAGVRGGNAGRKAVFATYVSTGNWTVIDGRDEPNLRLDLTDYDHYFYSEHYGRFSSYQGYIRKHTVINNSNADEFVLGYYPSRTLEVSGIAGTNYFVSNDIVAYNATTNPTPYPDIIFGNGDTNVAQAQPLNTLNNTNNILKFRKSVSDNNLYLMFSDSNENLVFQKYSVGGQTWSVLPSIGLVTSTANFFTTMAMNPVNGDMYVTYLDGGKVSVKRFSIELPLTKYYVNKNISSGDGSGDSWANAMPNLTDALSLAGTTTTDIWVAAGTYKPSSSARSTSFNLLVDNLQVIGGFDGTETSISQRNIAANPTILSGDLNGDDAGHGTGTRGDNSYHVLQINANNIVLDGLSIEKGHANGSSTNAYGGGLLISSTAENSKFKNCEFNSNFGLTGGAIRVYHNVNTSTVFENCVFNDNYSRYGSGLYFLLNNNRTATLDLVNCLFTNNRSYDVDTSNKGYTGSSVWARANGTGSNLTTTITNCTFANNTDIGTQSGVAERGTLSLARRTDGSSTHNATINNSIFYNNEGAGGITTLAVNKGHVSMPNLTVVNNSIDEDAFSNLTYLTNTSNLDPLFTDVLNNDFTLQTGSPAIDSGDSSYVPLTLITDLLGNARIQNSIVDMGCYESISLAINLDIDIFLQGAALNPNAGEETLMRDDLRVAGIIPTTSPYSDNLVCNSNVFAITGDNAIVDWIWIELRDANDNTNVIEGKSALLQRDGDVVSLDGVSSVDFNQPSNDYYIVVNHRNHLGIMTLNTIALSTTLTTVDFINGMTTFGTNAQKDLGSGTMGLWAGDANGDNNLNYIGTLSEIPSISAQVFNDPNNTVFGGPPVATYASSGYSNADVNMDGITKYIGVFSDVPFVSDNIFNNPSNTVFGGPPIATYVFPEQLP